MENEDRDDGMWPPMNFEIDDDEEVDYEFHNDTSLYKLK